MVCMFQDKGLRELVADVLSASVKCNDSSPPLVDIVLFGLPDFPSRFLKRFCYGEVSTPYKQGWQWVKLFYHYINVDIFFPLVRTILPSLAKQIISC